VENSPTHIRSSAKTIRGGRGPITEYSHRELVTLIQWINSDGPLRTQEELIAEAVNELGFQRRASRIVAVLEAAIVSAKR
jgi:hypothetical protein